MDVFAMGRSPGAAIYDQIESQNRKNLEYQDTVLARLGDLEDSNDNDGSAAGRAEGLMGGELATDGDGLDEMDDIDAHMNGFEEGLEGSSEEGVTMAGGKMVEDWRGAASSQRRPQATKKPQ